MGDLWVCRSRGNVDLDSHLSQDHPLIGWVGWWPVYGNVGAHDVILLRHGVYTRSYSRTFAASPNGIPEPSGGWPEVTRTDRR